MAENQTIKGEKLNDFVYNRYCENELNTSDLVELIQLCGDLLNLKTIPDYAKANKLSYQGAKTCRNVIELFNVKFIIETE